MVLETTQLVKKGDLEASLQEILAKERGIIEDLEKILLHVRDEEMREGFERKLSKTREAVAAIEAGFVPVDIGWFTRVDTKAKWSKQAVKDALDSMPDDIREIWEKVKTEGIFKTFSISTGGDPTLVGNSGGRHFFIGCWLCLNKDFSLGVRIRR